MPILKFIRFEGTLLQGVHIVPIGFKAGIDDDGGLMLSLEAIRPAGAGRPFDPQDRPL